jgi:hypothetical protein
MKTIKTIWHSDELKLIAILGLILLSSYGAIN